MSVGASAGQTNQGANSIAIGVNAGQTNQQSNSVAIGNAAGQVAQSNSSVAIGVSAAQFNQSNGNVALGFFSGYTGQGQGAVAVGLNSGEFTQGVQSIAIGENSGNISQGANSIALGTNAGLTNQGIQCVAIGLSAGQTGQGANAVAIGNSAGQTGQGANAIAIGNNAGTLNQFTQSIILNASGNVITTSNTGFYVNPIRQLTATGPLLVYNSVTSEISYAPSSKTFVIPHPLNDSQYLVHACLEGPEAGVYYRGENKIKTDSVEVELPAYTDALASDWSIQLTPISDGPVSTPLSVSKVQNGKFTVYGPSGKFFWTAYGRRAEIKTEVNINDSIVLGDGPYKYLSY